MTKNATIWTSVAVASTVLALTGCGSGTSPSSSGAAQSTAATASAATASATSTSTGGAASGSATATTAPASVPSLQAVVDPCTLVTQDEAKTALGSDPGPPKRGPAGSASCSYGTAGSGAYLLMADADKDHIPGAQNATQDSIRVLAQQAAAKAGDTVQDTSGIGDFGFMVVSHKGDSSYIFFLKGSTFVSIVVLGTPANPPTADVMTTLAKAAADRV